METPKRSPGAFVAQIQKLAPIIFITSKQNPILATTSGTTTGANPAKRFLHKSVMLETVRTGVTTKNSIIPPVKKNLEIAGKEDLNLK